MCLNSTPDSIWRGDLSRRDIFKGATLLEMIEFKPAEEVRQMVLARMKNEPVIPPGMDVNILPSESGWRAEGVPPQGQHIAYRDAIHCIGLIGVAMSRTIRILEFEKDRAVRLSKE